MFIINRVTVAVIVLVTGSIAAFGQPTPRERADAQERCASMAAGPERLRCVRSFETKWRLPQNFLYEDACGLAAGYAKLPSGKNGLATLKDGPWLLRLCSGHPDKVICEATVDLVAPVKLVCKSDG